MTSFPLAMVGGVVLGVVDRVVLANTPEDPGTNTLVMFILLVVLVLLRARSQSPTTPRGPSRRGRGRARPSCSSTRWRACVRYGGIALPARDRARCSRSSRSLPSRLIDYSIVLVFLMVAVSATVLTGWAGSCRSGSSRSWPSARTSPRTTAHDDGLTSRRSRSAVAWGVGIAIVIGIPALRVRGLYLGIITLGFSIVVSGYLILQDRFNNSFTRLRRASRPANGRTRGTSRPTRSALLLLLLRRRACS